LLTLLHFESARRIDRAVVPAIAVTKADVRVVLQIQNQIVKDRHLPSGT
jgi:hypothetical protein